MKLSLAWGSGSSSSQRRTRRLLTTTTTLSHPPVLLHAVPQLYITTLPPGCFALCLPPLSLVARLAEGVIPPMASASYGGTVMTHPGSYGSVYTPAPPSHHPDAHRPRQQYGLRSQYTAPETTYEPQPSGSVVRHGRYLLNWWLPVLTVFIWWLLHQGLFHHNAWGLKVCGSFSPLDVLPLPLRLRHTQGWPLKHAVGGVAVCDVPGRAADAQI